MDRRFVLAAAGLLLSTSLAHGLSVRLTPEGSDLTRKTGDSFFVKCDLDEVPDAPSKWDSSTTAWRRVSSDGTESPIPTEGKVREMPGVGLMFYDVTEAEAGLYRCRADFNGDEATGEFNLRIIKKIKFVDCELEQHPTAGQEAVIRCEVTADPAPDLIWYKNSKRIHPNPDGTSRYTLGSGNRELRIASFDPAEDDGVYDVHVAQKASGDIYMRVIKVSGYVGPSAVNVTQAGKAYEAQALTLHCAATGKPAPDFVWFKGTREEGEELAAGPKYTMETSVSSSALSIAALTAEDAGTYTCFARNDVDQVSQTLALDVFLKPRIDPMDNRTVSRGTDVELRCGFSGDGDVTAFWTFRGHSLGAPDAAAPELRVVEGAFTSVEEPNTLVLHLDDVDLADADEYQCTASNAAGDDVERVFLSVFHAPNLASRSPEPVRATVGAMAHLDCEVDAVPRAAWTWHAPDGSEIVSDGQRFTITTSEDGAKSTLKLIPNDQPDFGQYRCQADNGQGEAVDEPLTVLRVVRPPSPAALEAEGSHPNYALLSVRSLDTLDAGQLPLNVSFFFAEEGRWLETLDGEVDGFDWRAEAEVATLAYDADAPFRVSLLQPSTRYVFKALAANEAGESQLSDGVLKYQTSEPRAPAAPIFVVGAGDGKCEQACELSWTEPNSHGADITEYTLKYFRVGRDGAGDNPAQRGGAMWAKLAAHERSVRLTGLEAEAEYEFQLVAVNDRGQSEAASLLLRTGAMSPSGVGLGAGALVAIVLLLLLLVLLGVDLSCCLLQGRGVLARVSGSLCARPDAKAKELAMEEGAQSDRTPLKEKLAEPKDGSSDPLNPPAKPPNPNNPKDTTV